jgi:hypothetical protein
LEDPTLLTVLIGWLPMLLLIGVFIYFTRTLMSRTRSISRLISVQYMEELLKETRRHNEHVERLLASTNERLSIIERHRQL